MELRKNSDLGIFFEAGKVAVVGSFKEEWMGGYGVNQEYAQLWLLRPYLSRQSIL